MTPAYPYIIYIYLVIVTWGLVCDAKTKLSTPKTLCRTEIEKNLYMVMSVYAPVCPHPPPLTPASYGSTPTTKLLIPRKRLELIG